jgi:hypothetical protein
MAKKAAGGGYRGWASAASKAEAFAGYARGIQAVEPVVRRATAAGEYLDIAPNRTSVRDRFTRDDYEAFRPEEAIPTKPKDIIKACMDAYRDVGLVRNMVDLMADFTVQGLDINHPNERIEKFHKEWFRRVGGPSVSERFCNYLYRTGNVLPRRHVAKLTARDEERLRKAVAEPDMEMDPPPQVGRREIPMRYSFLNPLSVEVVGGELAQLLGADSFRFSIKLPESLAKRIAKPKGQADREMVAKLPPEVRAAAQRGDRTVLLRKDRVRAYYYKRDDWAAWATPLLTPILPNLIQLRKMQLCDIAALDGAISCIRVWKLGSLDHSIVPEPEVMTRLAEMLAQNVGGGVMDLVWGPDIDLIETSTDVHQFLGETKYAPVLNLIYAGLGIPPTLTGSSAAGGFTNNWISMKTLVERLEYGRAILRMFWEEELRIIQKAMGFRFPATLVFDNLLTDEAQEKQLLLSLADRDLISIETVQELFGLTPEIEAVRTRREHRRRKDGLLPPKASPFHSPHVKDDLVKSFAATGAYPPSQFGVELQEGKEGEQAPLDVKAKHDQSLKPKGEPGEGRPLNSKDSKKRKRKKVSPRTSAFMADVAWADDAQAAIAGMVGPAYLKARGKKTLRELTEDESRKFEKLKFALLCQFKAGAKVTREEVGKLLGGKLSVPRGVWRLLRAAAARYAEANGRAPTLDVARRLQSAVFAAYRGDY